MRGPWVVDRLRRSPGAVAGRPPGALAGRPPGAPTVWSAPSSSSVEHTKLSFPPLHLPVAYPPPPMKIPAAQVGYGSPAGSHDSRKRNEPRPGRRVEPAARPHVTARGGGGRAAVQGRRVAPGPRPPARAGDLPRGAAAHFALASLVAQRRRWTQLCSQDFFGRRGDSP